MNMLEQQYRIIVDKMPGGEVIINEFQAPTDDPLRVFWLKIYSFGAVPGDMLEVVGRTTPTNGLVVEVRTYGNAQMGIQIIPSHAEHRRRPRLPWRD